MISLAGVTKVFYTDDLETHALDGIHLDVAKGEFLSISGPSGCGKSTLLALLGLLDTPTEGKYLLDSQDVTGLTPAARARTRNERIGFIFQAFNLIGDLTVLQNVELPLTYRASMPADERRKAAVAALERVGMSHRVNHTRRSSRAGSSSAWRWPARSPGGPRSCSPTNRPGTWTRATAKP